MSLLKVESIECRYRGQAVIRDLSFAIDSGELCCLLGPSGGGKTTVLRTIAGFESVFRGQISLNGRPLSTPHGQLPPEKREIGLVFQQYALFPHLNARENIAFGLRRMREDERCQTIDAILETVHLSGAEALRYPQELSGGQQQRVALARALVLKPRLLLLDEPFSNLDASLRRELNLELKKLLKQQHISALLVTHDQEEAFAFADKMGLLHRGCLQQWDTPYNLYHQPRNRFTARFIGQGRLIPGQRLQEPVVHTALGDFPCATMRANQRVDVLLRPDDVLYDPDSTIRGTVIERLFAGDRILYTLRLQRGGDTIQALLPSHRDFSVGTHIGLRMDLQHLVCFAGEDTDTGPQNHKNTVPTTAVRPPPLLRARAQNGDAIPICGAASRHHQTDSEPFHRISTGLCTEKLRLSTVLSPKHPYIDSGTGGHHCILMIG